MFQSSFTGIVPLHSNASYFGGFCKFWYIPVEWIATFPRINAANQFLIGEPALIPDASWFGPITVPKDKLGFSEPMKRTKAGPYYELKVEGVHIGDSAASRVNLENMPYHKYLVVGKVRAGGFYMLIGSVDSPLRFDSDYKGGSRYDTAQTAFAFFTEHISKAYILPAFTAPGIIPETGEPGEGEASMANKKEIIPFVNQSVINIPWTPTRSDKFGSFPILEVWIDDGENAPYLNLGGSIEADHPAPAFTQLSINLGLEASSGFIVIS